MKEIKVGLLGFGTVGVGVAQQIQQNSRVIEAKLGARLTLKRIAVRNSRAERGMSVPPGVLTTDVAEILDDPEISIVVELIGGYEPARSFVLRAIENGKHVVTANKALLAVHGAELFAAAARRGVEVRFESAVGGGIPVLSAILGNMAVNNFSMVLGILNGTCNYILSRMTREGADFSDVLKTAQQLGYAETDPTFDIEGVDTAHKLCLLCSLCFGTWVNLTEIHTEGIGAISSLDISFAEAFGYRIKLLAIGKRDGERIEARVHPTMIPLLHPLADVDGVFNAIRVTGDFAGPVMLSGRGAGRDATASAVLGDLLEIARNLKVGVGRRCAPLGYLDGQLKRLEMKPMGEIIGKYYLRFNVEDRPGALGRIAGLLGRNGISIESVIQASRKAGESVPVVLIIHKAREMDVQRAVTEIDALEIITEQSMLIRIEDNLE